MSEQKITTSTCPHIPTQKSHSYTTHSIVIFMLLHVKEVMQKEELFWSWVYFSPMKLQCKTDLLWAEDTFHLDLRHCHSQIFGKHHFHCLCFYFHCLWQQFLNLSSDKAFYLCVLFYEQITLYFYEITLAVNNILFSSNMANYSGIKHAYGPVLFLNYDKGMLIPVWNSQPWCIGWTAAEPVQDAAVAIGAAVVWTTGNSRVVLLEGVW